MPDVAGGKKKRKVEHVFDPNRLMHDINSVAIAIDKCTRTVKRMVKDGRFPEPDYIDGNVHCWTSSLLFAWFKEKTGKEAA
jgi:predicted DNA-binding transcriptional regulator AlpA